MCRCHEYATVCQDSPSGRYDYSPLVHKEAIEWFQPHLIVLPAEELPSDETVGAKRQRRSVEKASDLYVSADKSILIVEPTRTLVQSRCVILLINAIACSSLPFSPRALQHFLLAS